VAKRAAQKVLCVAGLRHHLEARLGKQAADALAQEDVVLADHHPHGL
jgi:hypothetical protein